MCDLASEETSVESMSELLDELERVRDRQEKIIALLRKSSLRPDVRFTLDDAIKQAEHDLDEYNALLTRYGRAEMPRGPKGSRLKAGPFAPCKRGNERHRCKAVCAVRSNRPCQKPNTPKSALASTA
jgi:hypothetical protein